MKTAWVATSQNLKLRTGAQLKHRPGKEKEQRGKKPQPGEGGERANTKHGRGCVFEISQTHKTKKSEGRVKENLGNAAANGICQYKGGKWSGSEGG